MHSHDHRRRALELAQALVPSTPSAPTPTCRIIHFIRDELARLGVKSQLTTYNAERTKANLFATLGEGKPAGVILSGHTEHRALGRAGLVGGPLGGRGEGRPAVRPGSADVKASSLAWPRPRPSWPAGAVRHPSRSATKEIGCFASGA